MGGGRTWLQLSPVARGWEQDPSPGQAWQPPGLQGAKRIRCHIMRLCVCEGWHKGFSEAASEPFLASPKKAGSGTWLLSSLETPWGAVPRGTGWALGVPERGMPLLVHA